MGKKDKLRIRNMKLEQNELSSTTIGAFENRKKSSVGAFVLVGFFILVVVFLPDISDMVHNYVNKPVTVNPTPNPTPVTPTPEPDEPRVDDTVYPLTSDLRIEREDVLLNEFVLDKDNATLNFNVINNSGQYQAIENLNYYLELYNESQTLLGRIKLTGEQNLASGAFVQYKKNIEPDVANALASFTLVKKTALEYPAFNVTGDASGEGILTCSSIKNNSEVTYSFKNDELTYVRSEVTFSGENLEATEEYNANKAAVERYHKMDGVVSIFTAYDGGYKITTDITSNQAKRFYVFDADSFAAKTSSRVVKFEMEAQGYKCE